MDFQYEHNQSRVAFSIAPPWIPRWKRILDVSIVVLALPLVVPVAAFVGLLIRLVSEGPVLFKQERIGYLGQRFMCFKFRTMFAGADTAAHQRHLHRLMDSNVPMAKMDSDGDPRIIPFGRLLRSTGLDELPQLINVFRGEMSLVGPRPCLAYEYDRYLPWQRERFATLPGLTGLWQVSGKNRTTFVEMIQLDIKYARTKSMWRDLGILLRTVPALTVQIWETRRREKFASNRVSDRMIPPRRQPIQSSYLPSTTIAGIARAERREPMNVKGLKTKL